MEFLNQQATLSTPVREESDNCWLNIIIYFPLLDYVRIRTR